jgi:hypothetical protein
MTSGVWTCFPARRYGFDDLLEDTVKELADLAPVITGSLLTIFLGGVLGFLFQNRSWDHRHKIQREEQERERAVGVFDEVSRLMDKRLYRLKLV